MAGAFRDQLRTWGEQCSMTGKAVKIRLRTDVHGNVRTTYKEARRIVTSFASLRTWERDSVRKYLTATLGSPDKASANMPMQTPFENVICRIYTMENGLGHEVHFIRDDDEMLKGMFEDVTDEEGSAGIRKSVYNEENFKDGWINPEIGRKQAEAENSPHDLVNLMRGIDDMFAKGEG